CRTSRKFIIRLYIALRGMHGKSHRQLLTAGTLKRKAVHLRDPVIREECVLDGAPDARLQIRRNTLAEQLFKLDTIVPRINRIPEPFGLQGKEYGLLHSLCTVQHPACRAAVKP